MKDQNLKFINLARSYHRMTYLINVIAGYRLSSIHQAFLFLLRVCFASKIFWRPMCMLIFDIFFPWYTYYTVFIINIREKDFFW